MKVSAVVISHGHADELAQSLPVLAPQVDELLVIANIPGSVPAELPDGVRVLENARPLSFAANANLGAAHTEHELVLIANPDAVPEPDAVGDPARVHGGASARGRCRPEDALQRRHRGRPRAAAFPTVGATLVRRTPLRLAVPAAALAAPALPARRAARRACARRHDARRVSPAAPRDARRDRRLGRRLPHVLRGHRPQLPRREGRLGALVRPGRRRPPRVRGRRSTSASSRGTRSGTRARWRASCASTPSACSRDDRSWDKYAGGADALERRGVRRFARRISRGVPTSFATLGPALEPGDAVLDLACGDGGLGDFLPEHRYRRRRRERGDGRRRTSTRPRRRAGGSERLRAGGAGAGDDDLPGDLLRAGPARAARADRRLHRDEARLRPQPAPVPARGRRAPTCAPRASTGSTFEPFFVPQTPRSAAAGGDLVFGCGAHRAAGAARAPHALHLLCAPPRARHEAVGHDRAELRTSPSDGLRSCGTNFLSTTTWTAKRDARRAEPCRSSSAALSIVSVFSLITRPSCG